MCTLLYCTVLLPLGVNPIAVNNNNNNNSINNNNNNNNKAAIIIIIMMIIITIIIMMLRYPLYHSKRVYVCCALLTFHRRSRKLVG
jgi:cell division protein FtsW (lipid II flippase)